MPVTRRNGKLSSCEPCRKSKLRCDHTTPVCGRCLRLNKQHLCIYHPAPSTRAKYVNKNHEKHSASVEFSENFDSWGQKKASLSTPGFLGHTSYSSAFTDHGSGLDMASPLPSSVVISVDPQHIHLGVRVLVLMKNLPLYREILTARYKVWQGWTLCWPIVNMLLSTTENMWNSVQREEAHEYERESLLSRKLFEMQTQPMEIHSDMSWSEFASAAAGRWETIGLLFTVIGLAIEYLPCDHPVHCVKQDGQADAESIKVTATAVGNICLQFCSGAGIVNDIVCWLLLHHTSLLTTVYGDSGMFFGV